VFNVSKTELELIVLFEILRCQILFQRIEFGEETVIVSYLDIHHSQVLLDFFFIDFWLRVYYLDCLQLRHFHRLP